MRGSAGKLCAVAFALLALSGCALEGEGSSAGGGAIEVAVVQTCEAGSSSDCVVIEGEHVLVTDESFETVDVEDVAAADGEAGSSVTLGLGERGVAVLGAATTDAVEAGKDARLVIRVGDDMVSAVTVMEPIHDDQLTITLSDGLDPEQFVDQIRGS